MQGNPCKSEFLEKSKSKQKHTLQGAFLFSEQGFPCIGYNIFLLQLLGFPCFSNSFFSFGYILSLFYYHFFPVQFTGFSLFYKNSDFQGIPCVGYNSFMFQLQGFTCFNNTFSLFWLHYFPVFLTFFPCLIYRVFPNLLKI